MIASPSLMEQIVGAPQRVIAMLPTAQQLFYRAKNQVAQQMGVMSKGGGVGFSTRISPELSGANRMAGTLGLDSLRTLGSHLMPGHTNMPGLSQMPFGEALRGLRNDSSVSGTEALKVGKRADAAVQAQLNVAPNISIKVEDLERQWDTKIAPKVKQLTIETYRQMRNAEKKGLSR